MIDTFSKKIIQETFENSFNKEKFTNFIKNLLNHFDDSDGAKFIYRGQTIPEVYRDKILSFERIGKYIDPEDKKIDILIVNLKNIKSLDRARTLQRNFIAWYLDGSRGGQLKDAALVAFVSPDSDSWRFSLVKMDYKIQDAKVKKDLTPAKRYSFLVGSQEKSHTAQSRLVSIIEDDKNSPSLKQIEEAFNIEKVTKEFFEKYTDLFIRLKESLDELVKKDNKIKTNFEEKNIDTVGFAKKLLGQIVFLYFLQKKGWFGVKLGSDWGTGPKNFLRELFDKKKVSYKNFFNDILEPLFYEALANKRDDDYYHHLSCKIPFLNGGLFDPINDYDWVNTDVNIDNEIFSNNFKTKEGDFGTGILDVFDRYNFTVREDEPLEKEVAVDPEMLGKVFENLLEIKDRKSKGTYYTPREIVHYMCQESLINYLHSELENQVSKEDLEVLIKKGNALIHNDQSASLGKKDYEEQIPKSIKKLASFIDIKLADIKVCDPAVGSGAFLVGMMNEIINAREVLSYILGDTKERNIYKFKRWSIKHSLYGVDIEPSAVDIAKLRLWLSLVVEEDDIKKIKPLPNLDYKIMQGNSLLEEFKGVKLFDEKLLIKEKVSKKNYISELNQQEKELQSKLLPYYLENPRWNNNRSLSRPIELAKIEIEMDKIKAKIKKEIQSAKEEQIDIHQNGFNFSGDINEEDIWLNLKKLYSRFFKSSDRSKKKSIKQAIEKVVWELIETTIRNEGKLEILKEIEAYKNKGIRPFFLWKLNFADVFQEKGGFDIVIGNPPYITYKGKQKVEIPKLEIKAYLDFYKNSAEYKINSYALFVERAFLLLKNSGTLSYIIPSTILQNEYLGKIRSFILNNFHIDLIITFGNKVFEAVTDSIILNCSKEQNNYETKTLRKMDLDFSDKLNFTNWKQNNWLNEYGHIINLKCNFVDVNLFIKIESNSVHLGSFLEVYVGIVANGIKKFLSSTNNNENYKKYLQGKHLNRFFLLPKKLFINFDIKKLHSNTDKSVYEKSEKILVRKTGNVLIAAYDNSQFYTDQSIYNIYPKDSHINLSLKYICALLNSKLMNWYFNKKMITNADVFPYIKGIHLKKLPIKEIYTGNQKPFIEIVDKILEITKSDDYKENPEKMAKVKDYEKQIDQMVYKLYGLSEEEIKIVEGESKNG